MKRLSKTFLVLGVLALIVGGFTGCPGEVNPGTSPETTLEQGTDAITIDFSQTEIAVSTNTYPAKAHTSSAENPEIIDSTKNLDQTLAAGTPVKSSDNILSVTPVYNGLAVRINCNATEESKSWKHNSLIIQNVTDNANGIEVADFALANAGESLAFEFLYKFTESGKKYKIWMNHMGEDEYGNWNDWGTTEESAPVEVTAIGGSGELNIYAADLKIEKDSNNNRIFNLENFSIIKPSSLLNNITLAIRNVRIEKGSRWTEGAEVIDIWKDYEIDTDKFTIDKDDEVDVGEGQKVKIVDFIAGQTQLFFHLNCKFTYGGYEYHQDFFANYEKWVSDYFEPAPLPEHQFHLIKIVSTENGGDNGFIKQPIAHHVKDAQQTWNDFSNVNTPDPYYEKCTIAVDDGNALPGKVKVRGNWTTNYDKKSLRIKFDEKQNMCNLHGGKKFKNWVLLAVWKDASLMRDATALKMYKAMFPDYYASDCQFVEVEANGEYLGVYLLAEQQEVKKNRINITEADEKNPKNTKIGYLIEFDSYYNTEIENERFEINYGNTLKDYEGREIQAQDFQKGYTIKSDIYSAEQKEFLMKYMNRLWALCYNAVYNKRYFKFRSNYTLEEYTPAGATDDEKCRNCISAVIDVDSLACMYIFSEIVCDPDLYLTSFIMDIDFGEDKDHKLRFEAPWDFDSTMGNKNFCVAESSSGNIVGKNDMFAGAAQTDVNCEHERIHANPWMIIFINQAWFQKLVKDKWTTIDTATVLTSLQNFIDANSASKYEAVFNYTRYFWGTPDIDRELCDASKTASETSQAASATYFKQWLTARFDAVDTIIKNLQ